MSLTVWAWETRLCCHSQTFVWGFAEEREKGLPNLLARVSLLLAFNRGIASPNASLLLLLAPLSTFYGITDIACLLDGSAHASTTSRVTLSP